jgi:hypothetical protein
MDGWKVTQVLSESHLKLKKRGMKAGFHNHGGEWKATLDAGKRPRARQVLPPERLVA